MNRGWLLSLVPLDLGVIFLALGVHNIYRVRHLRRTGATAYGHIVRHDTDFGENGTLYHPVAAWQTPDGRWREYTSRIGSSGKGRYQVGTPVLVHYDPADPTRAAIQGYDGGGTDWLFAAIGGLLITGSLVVFAVAFQG